MVMCNLKIVDCMLIHTRCFQQWISLLSPVILFYGVLILSDKYCLLPPASFLIILILSFWRSSPCVVQQGQEVTNGSCQINKDPVLSSIIILSLLCGIFFFISFHLCLESSEQLDFLFLQCRKVSKNCIRVIIEHIWSIFAHFFHQYIQFATYNLKIQVHYIVYTC